MDFSFFICEWAGLGGFKRERGLGWVKGGEDGREVRGRLAIVWPGSRSFGVEMEGLVERLVVAVGTWNG